MLKILVVGLGGFIGATLRYIISGWVYGIWSTGFPYGTLIVNVVGSFLLGFLMAYMQNIVIHPNLKIFLTIGLLGAFTTFSTFSYETYALFEIGAVLKALLNIGINVTLGLILVYLGVVVGRII